MHVQRMHMHINKTQKKIYNHNFFFVNGFRRKNVSKEVEQNIFNDLVFFSSTSYRPLRFLVVFGFVLLCTSFLIIIIIIITFIYIFSFFLGLVVASHFYCIPQNTKPVIGQKLREKLNKKKRLEYGDEVS
jgi:hypothetical protein